MMSNVVNSRTDVCFDKRHKRAYCDNSRNIKEYGLCTKAIYHTVI